MCLGAFVGKYIAMLTYYLPQILLEGCDKGREPRDIFKWFFQKPFCWSCKKPLPRAGGVPILGYFSLKGECPHCKFSIRRMFILELLVAFIFGTLTLFSSFTPTLIFVLIVTCLLICCFITDLEYSLLPDQLTLALVWVGLLGSLLPVYLSPQEAIIGAVGGYGIFWIINEIYRFFRQRDGMFPGDFKLNAGIGACIGFKMLLPVLVIALLLLIVITMIKILSSKESNEGSFLHKEVCYGCYLSVVAVTTLFLMFFGAFNP